MTAKLKLGFIVDEWGCSKYDLNVMHWASEHPHIEAMLVVQTYPKSTLGRLGNLRKLISKRGFWAACAELTFGILTRIDNILLKRSQPQHADHLQLFDPKIIVSSSVSVAPNISNSGYVHRFSENDIVKLREQNFDVLMRCGSGILRGEILQCAVQGVWSFHHADNRINRGGPPAFWEVLYKNSATGFVIQRLTDELDGGDLLFRGAYPTKWFYLFNQAEIYLRATHHMQQLLQRLITQNSAPPVIEDITPYSQRLFRTPTLWQQFQYLRYFLYAYLRYSILFRRRIGECWSVGFLQQDWKDAALWRAHEIPNPPGRFLADPFVVQQDGRSICFVEDFHFSNNKGVITAYELVGNQATELGVALQENFHLSYPFLFRHEGQLHMCPEAYQSGEIRVYVCDEFPLKWSLKKVLMSNVAAADTSLFFKHGKWWLLTNIDPIAQEQHCAELHLYYADDLFADAWQPHPKNPIIFDPLRARNGGFILDQDEVFRVAQVHGFDNYGYGFSINRITHISETDYTEECVFTGTPDFKPGIIGTHHMHSDAGTTVFDFLRLGSIRPSPANYIPK